MTFNAFPVLGVSGWAPEPEPATRGKDDKAWLTDPRTGLAVLFKPVVVNARGLEQGEDWSEKLASEIDSCWAFPARRSTWLSGTARRG